MGELVEHPKFVETEKDHDAEHVKMLDKAGEAIARMCNVNWIAKEQAYINNPELQQKQSDLFLNKVVDSVETAKQIAQIRERVKKRSDLKAEGLPETFDGFGTGGKVSLDGDNVPHKELLLDITGHRAYNTDEFRFKKVEESLENTLVL
jgi:hypothetical protein